MKRGSTRPTMLAYFLLLHCFKEAASGGIAGMEAKVDIIKLVVPEYVKRGDGVDLECHWKATGEIYSIKWYFNDREFFAYIPNTSPALTLHPLGGINVTNHTTDGKVHLSNVQLASSGRYKCEVILESPAFLTADSSSNMTVVEIPEDKPTITGTQHQYRIGDTVQLNCSSPRSFPPADLAWFINEERASGQYLIPHAPTHYPEGLTESHLGLQFVVSREHFNKGAMTLRCTAKISPHYLKTQQHSVDGLLTYNVPPMESRAKSAMSGVGGGGGGGGGVVMLMVVVAVAMVVNGALPHPGSLR